MVQLRRRTSVRTTAELGLTPGDPGTSRRRFLRHSGGYATGMAALVGLPAAALLETAEADAATVAPKTVPNPTTPIPDGPVMAYVHDAKKGIVVIMSGDTERTVRDPALVAKLLRAPKKAKRKKLTRKQRLAQRRRRTESSKRRAG